MGNMTVNFLFSTCSDLGFVSCACPLSLLSEMFLGIAALVYFVVLCTKLRVNAYNGGISSITIAFPGRELRK